MNQLVSVDPAPALEHTFPATESQKELWAASRMDPGASCAFNESVTLELRGSLDVAALRRAAARVVQHHEALRATFSPEDGRVRVAARADVDLTVEDLSGRPDAERGTRVRTVLSEEVETSFDLEHGPLVRLRLLKLRPDEHWLVFTAHHIVCDGWSMAVALRDLGHFYSGTTAPPAVRFSDYARRVAGLEERPAFQGDLDYWRERFRAELPPLELPLDHRRPGLKSYRADRYDHALDPALVQALKKAGAKAGASFFATLLTGFAAFVHRLTGQRDLVVGIPAAGQSALGMENLVGHCVNFLPIRCDVDPARPFTELLKQVRGSVLDAQEHQQATFGRLLRELRVARDPSRLPLVSVMFNVDQALQAKDLPFAGLQVAFRSNPRHFENFELFINASEAAGRVVLECQYNKDLFDDETVRDRMASFAALLAGIAADPSQPVSRLPMLDLAQQQRVLVDWNDSRRDYPAGETVVSLLDEQFRRAPDRTALVFGGESLTYAELHARADRLAGYLRGQGVERGTLVGVCLERSVEMVVGVLAVLKAGGGYVPLDPSYPRERLHFMATDARVPVVLTQEQHLALFPPEQFRAVSVDRDRAAIDSQPAGATPCPAQPGDVAYVIYTSGSTGKPKGVRVPHGAVVNFLRSMAERPGIGADDVLLAVTTLSFDISVAETFLPLSVGAKIVLAGRETVGDGRQLAQFLTDSGATVLQATPSTWRLLLQAGWQGSKALSVWVGGEALPADLARALVERSRAVWNLYGPTETTVWSTAAHVTDAEQVHIGTPLANTQVYVLDPALEPVPVGVVGELYVGGAGVTLGYLDRPELTAERFAANPYHDPFADYLNASLYRTGDLVRWRRDGTLEYLGRNDHQVKLRGHRIELPEVEAVLARHPGVRQAVALVREDRPGDPRLVAYVVPEPGKIATATELRKFVRQELPEYMVPQHFVELETLPLTNNGKIDRKRLPAPFAAPAEDAPSPTTPAELYVAGLWQEVLDVPKVAASDNFFNLGGHSLLAFQVLARIEKDTGTRLPPRVLVLNTLAQLAAQVPAAAPRADEGRGLVGKVRGWFGG